MYTANSKLSDQVWTVGGRNVFVSDNAAYNYAGKNHLDLTNNSAGPNSISQTLSTISGDNYLLSFYAFADHRNTFGVTFGGTSVPVTTPLPVVFPPDDAASYTLYQYTVKASSSSTVLAFTGSSPRDSSGNDDVQLDNISVNLSAAPEPAQVCTLGFFGLGLLGLVLRARKRGFTPA